MSEHNFLKTSFKNYFLKEGHAHSSVRAYLYVLNKFLVFLNRERVDPEHVRQPDILTFLKNQKNASKETKAQYLLGIKHFFRFLKAENIIDRSPAEELHIRGLKKNTLYTILQPHELHQLYARFPEDQRKKALLGLLIYQGLQACELPKLETKHLNLREGTVFIPEGRRNEARTLPLHTAQVLDLHDYITYTRPELLKNMPIKTDQLLLGRESLFLKNTTISILKILREQHPHLKIRNAKHIRASVIVNQLKIHNLRQVQYFAGHRYISSTEYYLQSETESLLKEIEAFHPLG